MEYCRISLNGAPIATVYDIELDEIMRRYDFNLVSRNPSQCPIDYIAFYTDYKGNTLYLEYIYEEEEYDEN